MAREVIAKKDSSERFKEIQRSCRFCPRGTGENIVFDPETKERFSLCDRHLKHYNIQTDKLNPTTELTPEEGGLPGDTPIP